MKTVYSIYFIILIFFLGLTSCKEGNFLNTVPKDQITENSYWNTANDLETYLNAFYELFPGWGTHDGGPFWVDNNSDNMIPGQYDERLAGVRPLPQSGGGWSWGDIRSINIFLAKYEDVIEANGGTNPNIDHFIGEGYFFRAYIYYDLLQQFGGVPWIDEPTNLDSEELYASRSPRNFIADKILEDLDRAISMLKSDAGEFRVSRSVALAFKSRVALYEGTWQKYHEGTVFGAQESNPSKYLQEAVTASEELMEEGNFSIANTGEGMEDYVTLFNQTDLSDNPEIIFWKSYKVGFNAHNGQRRLGIVGGNTGLSKSLVNSYLSIDGKPISVSPLYQGDDNLTEEFTSRDPRLDAIIFAPGDPINEELTFQRAPIHLGGEARCTSGYQIQKGSVPDKILQQANFGSTTAAIIFRYAEVLLNFAEAKAELGTLTQTDLDRSINLLRDRVNMPHLQLSSITTDPNWSFPELSPVLNEIRRERRVELAAEGYRLDDLMRWRAHHLIVGKRLKGAKFNPSNYPELDEGDINLDDSGYIDPYQNSLPNGFQFDPGRDYLNPIPINELLLNENLTQNPGWPDQ